MGKKYIFVEFAIKVINRLLESGEAFVTIESRLVKNPEVCTICKGTNTTLASLSSTSRHCLACGKSYQVFYDALDEIHLKKNFFEVK